MYSIDSQAQNFKRMNNQYSYILTHVLLLLGANLPARLVYLSTQHGSSQSTQSSGCLETENLSIREQSSYAAQTQAPSLSEWVSANRPQQIDNIDNWLFGNLKGCLWMILLEKQ